MTFQPNPPIRMSLRREATVTSKIQPFFPISRMVRIPHFLLAFLYILSSGWSLTHIFPFSTFYVIWDGILFFFFHVFASFLSFSFFLFYYGVSFLVFAEWAFTPLLYHTYLPFFVSPVT